MPHSVIKLSEPDELTVDHIQKMVDLAINPIGAQICFDNIYDARIKLALEVDCWDRFKNDYVALLGKSYRLTSYSLDGRSMEGFYITVQDVNELCAVFTEILNHDIDPLKSQLSISIFYNKE